MIFRNIYKGQKKLFSKMQEDPTMCNRVKLYREKSNLDKQNKFVSDKGH